MDDMFRPLRKYATFSGRARRKEFWLWFLAYIIGAMVITFIESAIGLAPEPQTTSQFGDGSVSVSFYSQGGPLTSVYVLALLIPNIAVTVRRLHDTGRSGWWFLMIFLPIIGWIVLLVFYCLEGQRAPNEYGPDPKGADPAEVFA
jgi:uncharacterized membrane protein YhaH (DUF805 family)